MAAAFAVARAPFDALPEPVLRVIMLALPVDARARAACVCRSWRAFLADPSLWLHLDLTPAGGVVAGRVTENLVRGAVARAGGQMRVLCLNRVPDVDDRELLVNLVMADEAQLQRVNINAYLNLEHVVALCAAAPRLQVLNANVGGLGSAMLPLLRNDAPYGPLRVRELSTWCGNDDVLALAAAVVAHGSLKALRLFSMHSARGLNALVDAAAERRISRLSIDHNCSFNAEFVPALARLLQRGSLTYLDVSCNDFPHAQEESVPVLCAALRTCRTLAHLEVCLRPPGGASHGTVTELLDAAASLPVLTELNLSLSRIQAADAGRALGALLRADLPNLRILNVNYCGLGDEDLAQLLDGLAANTHLRLLDCGYNNQSEAFQRDRLEPALAALAARTELDA
jgi:hypothetical protein